MVLRVEVLVVDADDECGVGVRRRSRDDDAGGARFDVRNRGLAAGEAPCEMCIRDSQYFGLRESTSFTPGTNEVISNGPPETTLAGSNPSNAPTHP